MFTSRQPDHKLLLWINAPEPGHYFTGADQVELLGKVTAYGYEQRTNYRSPFDPTFDGPWMESVIRYVSLEGESRTHTQGSLHPVTGEVDPDEAFQDTLPPSDRWLWRIDLESPIEAFGVRVFHDGDWHSLNPADWPS